jgi:hypothetical protein
VTEYTRQRRSPRYEWLLQLYRALHVEGERLRGTALEKVFPGKSLPPQAHHVRRLVTTDAFDFVGGARSREHA